MKKNNVFATANVMMSAIILVVTIGGVFVGQPSAADHTTGYVQTANYYLRAGTDITPADYPTLAKYNVVVLPAEAQLYNRDMFQKVRLLNPSILFLAYVPSKSYNWAWVDTLHIKLRGLIQPTWWLTDPAGNNISVWPNTQVINSVSGWSAALPQFVNDEIWSTGLWDGIFYDEFSANISWVNGGNFDLHRDGVKDDPRLADIAWQESTINILKRTRALLGANAVIITNGDSNPVLQPYLNGRMFESFPTPWEGRGQWTDSMQSYARIEKTTGFHPLVIINTNTKNTGVVDYRKVRYGLTSTLMNDGYFSFDIGEADHGQLWRYDEEEVRLGRALGRAVNVTSPTVTQMVAGVWRRDFEKGLVFVNATGAAQTVRLTEEFEKIKGVQAPVVNDGSVTTSINVAAQDGILLLRPIRQIVGAAFSNGSYARIFSNRGAKIRRGFFAYDQNALGGATVIYKDINYDGRLEKFVADATRITVYDSTGAVTASFQPYGPMFTGGINLAVGDLAGDGVMRMVTAPKKWASRIRAFSTDGVPLKIDFVATSGSTNGASIALGRGTIVVGAGAGETPMVKIFSATGNFVSSFQVYAQNFRGGVSVAIGDVNGDRRDDIVTGAGPTGGPHIRIFQPNGALLGQFFATDPMDRNGVSVTLMDVDGDGTQEIIGLSTSIFPSTTTLGP